MGIKLSACYQMCERKLCVRVLARAEQPIAIGLDTRSLGFDADAVCRAVARLKALPDMRVQLVYAWAEEAVLLRRFTETRRRHPMAPQGRVVDGIQAEELSTGPLRMDADWVIDTSELEPGALRAQIEANFGSASPIAGQAGLNVSLISFAFPCGLPREADLVFDARFLRNPHYHPILRVKTGLDPEVGAYVEADPDFTRFFSCVTSLVNLVLPRFVQEGKKYATIAIGCTGGQHRSVHLIEKLANHLTGGMSPDALGPDIPKSPWCIFVTHRELARRGQADAFLSDRPVARRVKSDLDKAAQALSVQAQEA